MRFGALCLLVVVGLVLLPSCDRGSDTAILAATSKAAVCAPSAAVAICGPETATTPAARSEQTSRIDPEMAAICKKACEHKDYDAVAVVPAPRAKLGDLTRCPVSGVVFQVRSETPRIEHAGESYWLCCDGCMERFQQNPARFAGS